LERWGGRGCKDRERLGGGRTHRAAAELGGDAEAQETRARNTAWLGFIGGGSTCLHCEGKPPPLTRSAASSLDHRARRGNLRQIGGQPNAWIVARARTPCGVRGLQGPWSAPSLGKKQPQEDASGPGRRGRRGACAGGIAVCLYVSDWQRLIEIN
jgi:hypothetical protein